MFCKIAILTNSYPPRDVGGAARIAATQVKMLQEAGHEVRVWSPEVPWFRAHPIKRLWCHLRDLAPESKVVSDIIAWRPDILLTHNLTGCGFGTPRHIQKRGVRWIHMLHDIQLFEPSGRLFWLHPVTFWQVFWAFLRGCVFGNPDVVISPTRWLVKQHRRRSLLKSSSVHCEILPNPGPRDAGQSRRAFHESRVRLLFVGQVSRAKGSHLLQELTRTLRIPFELHIVGTGSDLAALVACSPYVVVHGVCGTNEVLAHMSAADILLVPSLIHENQPTVILEAASVALPVIASHCGGIIETLGAAAAHMVCAPDNVQAWCQAIQRLEDPHVYAHQAHLMRRVAEHHDPDAYAQRLLSLVISKR